MTQDEFINKFSKSNAKSPCLTSDEIRHLVIRDAAQIQLMNELYTDEKSRLNKRKAAAIAFKRIIVVIKPHNGKRYWLGPFLDLMDVYAGKGDNIHVKSMGMLLRIQDERRLQTSAAGYNKEFIKVELDDQ